MHTISKTKCMDFLIFLFFTSAITVSGANLHTQDGKGALRVFSGPAGATIIIDGNTVGVTPLKIINIDAGERRVALRLKGFAAVDSSVRITANETQTLTFALKPVEAHAGGETPSPMSDTLTVTTVPAGATLFIDDRQSGTTPYHSEKLAPGNYRLRLELQGYAPMEGTVSLKPGESHTVEKKMVGVYGALSVTTAPSGAMVTLNGHQLGATPFSEDKLLGGVYSLGLELPGYASISENITIDKGSIVNRQYALSRSQAWLDSVAAFKRAEYKHKRWTRRLVFGLLAAGCGGVGAYYNQAAGNAYSDYSHLNEGSDFHTQWEKVETDRITRNVLYSFAGAFAAAFIISIPF